MDWSTAQDEVRDEAGDEEQEHKVHGRESWQGWAGYDFPRDEYALPMQEDLGVLEPWSERDKELAKMIFNHIGGHPYWTRAWVVQGFCLARGITFVFKSIQVRTCNSNEPCCWQILTPRICPFPCS